MTIATFSSITIDANDAGRVADFWAAVLGTQRGAEVDDERFIFLEGRDGLPVVCIQRVPEPKVGKTRIHLDLAVDDLGAATERIVALGGSWDGHDRELDSFRWRTLTDPEGTEFDIVVE
jgi:predicted enzyme related to lactoylglutathione lyase